MASDVLEVGLFGWPPPLVAVAALVLGASIILGFAVPLTERRGLAGAIGVLTAVAALVLGSINNQTTAIAVIGVCALTALALILAPTVELEERSQGPEVVALVLLGAVGAIVLATGTDLLQIAIGLETLGLSAAVLVAIGRGLRPLEAAFKYFVLAAVSLAALLYGVGLIFLGTGSLALPNLAAVDPSVHWLVLAGTVLVAAGFLFELAVVPLHWGALDAYTAAEPVVAGWVMAASKLAAVLALGRLAIGAGLPVSTVLVAVGLLTIVWGTIAASAQTELRRMLAYSAIANAGFLAVALGSGPGGRVAAVFYVVVYAASTLLALVTLAGRPNQPIPYASLRTGEFGPLRAVMLGIALLSLAGIPPAPGFWAKLAILGPAWEVAGPFATTVTVLGGVAGALYYLRPLPDLFAAARVPAVARPAVGAAVVLTGAAVALLAVAPGLAWTLAQLTGIGA